MKKNIFMIVAVTLLSIPVQYSFAELTIETEKSVEELVNTKVPASSKATQIKKQMLNVKVSSVAKSSQSISNAAAAVFVIDQEVIRRSGVTSVPEALRMAPGIDVARINNSKWAITARGFNGRFANKLLVLIDGRSVYTSDFAGVYWNAQDVMLEDVERIEVIRGPGATLWGANAMNGVINIITKHTEDTQGGLLTAGGGTQETGFGALRYGVKLGEDTFARAYAKGFMRDQFTPEKSDYGNNADWSQFQGGFKIDSVLNAQDKVMLQGNTYNGSPKQNLETFASPIPLQDNAESSGWNITSRFNHTFSSTSDYSLQFYYDHYQNDEYTIDNKRDTLDLEFQHGFALAERQNVLWGLGYRYSEDAFKDKPLVVFTPNARNTQLFSAFMQDEISLFDDAVLFTVGSKLEHNDYTGFEVQPSASVMWTPSMGHKLWASVSRAVRTPSRSEHNFSVLTYTEPASSAKNPFPIPINVNLVGSPAYKAEQQLSYQLGYRLTFNHNTAWDITAFYNDYTTLRSSSFGEIYYSNGAIQQPVVFNNISSGNTYGFEMANVWQMLDWWRWDLSYGFLKTELNNVEEYQAAVSPEHIVSLRAGLNPMDKVNFDVWLRHVTAAKTVNPLGRNLLNVNGYTSLDVRLAWQPINKVELSITGQNLLQKQHIEYYDESFALAAGVPRGVYGKISWAF